MTCLTHYREFTAKLITSSDLCYQMYTDLMHKNSRNRNNTINHDTKYNVVHPQCRGYVHKTLFYSTCYKTTVLICALSCRSLQSLKATHTVAGLCAHSCRSFLNLLTKTLCTHSCRGRPRTQLGLDPFLQHSLSFAFLSLHKKS